VKIGYADLETSMLILKVFARKIIRPFGSVTLEDVQNEIRVVAKLCNRGHRNLIVMFEHGKLDSSHYYIDMEYCELHLEEYIARKWTPENKTRLANSPNHISAKMRLKQLWDIMEDITDGVAFIHSYKEIHRDLKPRNSINPLSVGVDSKFYTLGNKKRGKLPTSVLRCRGAPKEPKPHTSGEEPKVIVPQS